MATFAVERYLPGSTESERAHQVASISAASEQLAALGATLRATLVVPGDEVCMHLFEADAATTVTGAHEAVGLAYDRVVPVDITVRP